MQKFQDFCANAVYLPHDLRGELNHLMNSYFEDVRTLFREQKVSANIYLSGSLARQEPSVTWDEEGNLMLLSDIDFVIGATEKYLLDPWLVDLENTLRVQYPQFNTTIILLPIDRLANITSLFARDLTFSLPDPVYAPLPTPRTSPEPDRQESHV